MSLKGISQTNMQDKFHIWDINTINKLVNISGKKMAIPYILNEPWKKKGYTKKMEEETYHVNQHLLPLILFIKIKIFKINKLKN